MKDQEIYIADADVLTNLEGTGLMIRAQVVENGPGGPRRSGTYVHLQMTPGGAMRLLAQLQAAQREWGWPSPEGVPGMRVPPAKDRQ